MKVTTGEDPIWVYRPGYLGSNLKFSFQTSNGRWLKEESGSINAHPYEWSYKYIKAVAFWIRPNSFFTGYIAFESSTNSGYYIRKSGLSLVTAQNDGSSSFRDEASWIIKEEG